MTVAAFPDPLNDERIPQDCTAPALDLLLINPPWIRRQGNIWAEVGSCSPPLGLAYLAAYIMHHGHTCAILDMEAERLLPERLPERLRDVPRPRAVGISVTTSTFYAARDIVTRLREIEPAALYIAGGVHPTVRPEESLDGLGVDVVVRGEGEKPLLALLRGEPAATVPGTGSRLDGVLRMPPPGPFFPNLDEVPPPAYELLPMHAYHPALGSYRRLPAASMVVSRGCPGRCTFCFGGLLGQRWRFFSATRILADIQRLVTDYGIKEISFYDDTFTANPGIREVCEGIIRNDLDVSWVCFARVDTIDLELLRLMKKAGCHQIMFGLESADRAILRAIRKRFDPEMVVQAVKLSKQAGLDVRLAIMFGNPGETTATIERTIAFVKRLNPDILIANITTPYPGTEMFNWAKEHGCLRTENWDEYTLSQCVMELPTIASSDVEAAYAGVYRRFYLRPSYLLRRLARLRSPAAVQLHYQSLKAVLAMRSARPPAASPLK
ncbi:cobalamin-dependent protein [bacterium]|nr:cobalamin-dependent protein [candidate division CSSED10-310 bacterium]